MIALLIHFLGFLLINSAIPPYIESADAYFLAGWYLAFAAIDLIAICFASSRLRIILSLSFAWSCSLSIEQMMLMDTMQSCDWIMQTAIDLSLFGYLIAIVHSYRSKLNHGSHG